MGTLDGVDTGPPILSGLPSLQIETSLLAESRLRRSRYSILRRVRCECRDGVLWLRGCLPSEDLKQLALAEVANLGGFRTVVNDIEVLTPGAFSEAAERFGRIE